eukprot:TRINITY_DN48648_c0_g1_i1.p1 TRINITY_DN48648_c0_g1~~TRINITY_DN48648_c0_g1_i1.p1  ORF type:complete len:582 (-),score=47.70 TRINITY_DN48648_c0_g1_i1:9-1754(-)
MAFCEIFTNNVVTVVPKTCAIENLRLALFLWLLRLVSLSWCLYNLVENNALSTQSVPAGFQTFWSSMSKRYKAAQDTDRNQTFCLEAWKYDFQYDRDATFAYVDAKCFDIRPEERWMKLGDTLFLPSYIQESIISKKAGAAPLAKNCSNACQGMAGCSTGSYVPDRSVNGLGKCLCECAITRNRFVTAVEENVVAFEHGMRVVGFSGARDIEAFSVTRSFEEGQKIMTIVRDAQGKKLKVFQPGEVIQLTLGQLLRFADASLEDVGLFSSNFIQKPGVSKHPLRRLTGTSIVIGMKYYNKQDREHPGDVDYIVCFLDVVVASQWESKAAVDHSFVSDVAHGEDSYRVRYMFGMRVSFTASGSFSFFDPNKSLTTLASLLVYWSLPTAIVTLIAHYCLGGLSTFYMRASVESIEPGKMLHSLLNRSSAALHMHQSMNRSWRDGARANNQVQTSDLSDVTSAETSVGSRRSSFAKSRITSVVRELFHFTNSHVHGCSLADKQICALRSVMCGSKSVVAKDAFIEGFLANDPASLELCGQTFDVKRRRGFLERSLEDGRVRRLRERGGVLKGGKGLLQAAHPSA